MRKVKLFLMGLVVLTAQALMAAGEPMELVFDTNEIEPNTIEIPFYFQAPNVVIDWGDSTTTTVTAVGSHTHTYGSEGVYTVSISGNAEFYGKMSGADLVGSAALKEVKSFGDIGLKAFNSPWNNAQNLTKVPATLPSSITGLSGMFYKASTFNQDISGWDVSNVTHMGNMFLGATSFNAPIGSWDVSNVTYMGNMFRDATSFNASIGNWEVGKVTHISKMFHNAESFNQPIDGWDISSITNMDSLFFGALKFNQPLNSWDVSNVTNMGYLFSNAASFNQPLNNWDVSNVTGMENLFSNTINFNQPLNSWDVSKVERMTALFYGASNFNQPLNNWNVSNVTTMGSLFGSASSFNQPIDNWDVGNVTNMAFMFYSAGSFDQPIARWNASNVTNMRNMFTGARNFNQPLGSWDIRKVTDMTSMFHSVPLSTDNYDSILTGWSQLSLLPRDVNLGISGRKYTASAARNILINDYNWDLSSDGGVDTNQAPVNTTLPSFIGTETVGSTLTGNSGNWTDSDGTVDRYTYQWQRQVKVEGQDIYGETNLSYTVGLLDYNSKVRLKVIGYDNEGRYSTAYSAWSSTISPLTISNIKVSNTNKQYDGTATATPTLSSSEIADGSNVVFNFTANYSDTAVGNNKTINITGISLSGSDAAAYTLSTTSTSTTGDIIPKEITATTGGVEIRKTYDGNANITFSRVKLYGIVNFDDVRLTSYSPVGTFSDKNVGAGKSITTAMAISGADSGNYTFIQPQWKGDITAKALTLNISADDKNYDGTADATITIADDKVSGDDLTYNYSASFSDAKPYKNKTVTVSNFTLSGSDATNYTISSPSLTTLASINDVDTDSDGVFDSVEDAWGANKNSSSIKPVFSSSVDLTFGSGGIIAGKSPSSVVPYTMEVLDDGSVIVAGTSATGWSIPVCKYEASGVLVESYKVNSGYFFNPSSEGDVIYGSAIAPDGSLFIAGQSDSKALLAKYTAAGQLDTSFISDSE